VPKLGGGKEISDEAFGGGGSEIFLSVGLSFAAVNVAKKQGKMAPKEKTFHGVVTDTHCGAKGHMGDPAACIKKCVGESSKYALAVGKKVYVLDPQEMAAEHPAQHVIVKGTLAGDTITASSIEEAPAKKGKM
jgi:hypothetical protein